MKIRPVEPCCSMRTEGLRDRHDVANSQFSKFCESAKNLNERHHLRDVSAEGKVIPELKLTTSMFRTRLKLVFLSVFLIRGIISLDTLYLLTYLLTPWSRVLLEKLTGSAPSQEILRIFGTRRFLTILSSARSLSLS